MTSSLEKKDCYDYILLAVWEPQLMSALGELRDNVSPVIVTMVNSADPCDKWEAVCGKGRILPAFPGAGGGFDGDVLEADLTPRLIQQTTLGRKDGKERALAGALRSAGIPVRIAEDMHAWQICHLAMVVPIADAYYEAEDPARAGSDRKLMKRTAARIRENMAALSGRGIKLSPAKMNVFRIIPPSVAAAVLGAVFRSIAKSRT